jgi:magnesium-transporting ATPase (P-type)
MEWINILFLNPGNVVMLLAFYHGKSNWRAFGIIHASALLYSAFPCIGLGLFGEIPATNKLQFVLIYGLYATFPVAILARLWPNDRNLFSQKVVDNKNFLHRFIELFTVLHTVVFFATVGFWLYEHWNFLLHLDYSPLRVF